MSYPKTRLVFDRKKTATKTIPALVQIEVLYDRKRKYVSTGVKVCKHQWGKNGVCAHLEMMALNEKIAAVKGDIDAIINDMIERGEAFSFELLENRMGNRSQGKITFIDYVEQRIAERYDIRESTKKTHRKTPALLREYGKIVTFSDLTQGNIEQLDAYLHKKGIRQTTIHSYHKVMKTYIHDAMRRGLIDRSPYAMFKHERGEGELGRWLTEEEYEAIKTVVLPTKSLERVRDLFVLQCLTGLSFSDLFSVDFREAEDVDGIYYISGERVKTGVDFCCVLVPEAYEILERYDFVLPKISNAKYNMYLKVVASYAGIAKAIASHWGRRTCGMLLLNRGVSIEVVAKILGHSTIRVTEQAYAKVLDKYVVAEVMKKVKK